MRAVAALFLSVGLPPVASAQEDEEQVAEAEISRSGDWGLSVEDRITYLTGNEGVGYEYCDGYVFGVPYFVNEVLSIEPRYGQNRHDAVRKAIDWALYTSRFELSIRYRIPRMDTGPVFVELAPGWSSTRLEIADSPIPDATASGPSLGLGGGIAYDFYEVLSAGFVGRYTYSRARRLDQRYMNKNTLNGPTVEVGIFASVFVP